MSHENKSSVSDRVCSSKKEGTKYGLCLVNSYLNGLKEKELSPNTIETYRRVIKKYGKK